MCEPEAKGYVFFFMELHTHLEHWPKNWECGEIDGVFFRKKKPSLKHCYGINSWTIMGYVGHVLVR